MFLVHQGDNFLFFFFRQAIMIPNIFISIDLLWSMNIFESNGKAADNFLDKIHIGSID